MKYLFTTLLVLSSVLVFSQRTYWQQEANYSMEIDFDVTKHQFSGTQTIEYTNNSPDTLNKVFYHLYFNAFQPGSMMDLRSNNIQDPDRRVGSRISKLSPEEIGYLRVSKLVHEKTEVEFTEEGTILVVNLKDPILPGATTQLSMEFTGQVPIQIRRSGRNSREGIDYSMAQWYPKMCVYDHMGWHANPYIGREFYGIWGDFDVKITIDPSYIIGGTGYLQNPNEIGHGYEDEGVDVKKKKKPLTWHFKAPNVHDFMWGADPDYKHVKKQVPGGPMLHFFYQESSKTRDWALLPDQTVKAFTFLNKNFGVYPYEQFSVVQGGDGGMEYPMSTLITGERRLGSLVGVTVHEALHSWYQGVLGTNESLYPWMDEGFTSFASSITMDHLFNNGEGKNPHKGSYGAYYRNVMAGNEQALSMHSDHYQNNRGYGVNAYSKGAVFLHQLSYVIGQDNLMTGMRRYYNEWKFKHPTPNDFIRVMEKVSGMELDWYKEHFAFSTNTIDYGIDSVYAEGDKSVIVLKKKGQMMMPIDLFVETQNGNSSVHYIPLRIMRGEKENEYLDMKRTTEEDWLWTNPTYKLTVDIPVGELKSIIIDPTGRLADIQQKDNVWKSLVVEK